MPELQEIWGRNGYKTSGSWAEVFGDDARADEIFMAYFYGRYLNRVTQAGKAELNIPMYVNAWIYGVTGTPNPGTYPSGGPVARVMDIYHAAAPAVDFFGPDIYDKEFKEICALYTRAGNPLFFPESRNIPANYLYAMGKHAAMGVSPFGVEDAPAEGQFARLYKTSRRSQRPVGGMAGGRQGDRRTGGRRPTRNRVPGRIQDHHRPRAGAEAGGPRTAARARPLARPPPAPLWSRTARAPLTAARRPETSALRAHREYRAR